MEDKDEFLKQMENLKVPALPQPTHQKAVKIAIMNAERSAALGVWLVVLPCYFLFCVFMYHYSQNAARAYFDKHLTWFEAMYQMIVNMDKSSYFPFLGPMLLVLLPLICIAINTLAIIHVQVQKINPDSIKVREFNISVKIKGWNILLILISLAIVFVFISYVMAANGPIRVY